MRRWTDGKSWSASRVSGSFLTYREMEGKRGGGVSRSNKTPNSQGGSDDDHNNSNDEAPDGYRYKPDGLMKQSFSITTSTGQHLHLISYYARSHPTAPNLNQPSTDPALRHIRPQKGLYPESTVNDQQNLPVVTRGPMAGATFSLSPHAMGYPQPRGYAPLYTWPPTPLATPPTATIPYSASYLPPLSGAAAPYGQPPALPAPPAQQALPAPERPAHATAETTTSVTAPAHTSTAPAPSLSTYSWSPQSQSQSQPAPSPPHTSRVNSPSHGSQIDPRLTSQPPTSEPRPTLPLTPSQSHLPPPQPTTNGHDAAASSGTTVPSIGALMNGTSVPPYSKPIATPLSGSPNSLRHTDGPKDIPSEKIGIPGEDMRALRQLDRVFTA